MLIPGPDTRVVELRVHGILGTTPEDLVDAVAAVDVAGDGKGRLVRPADRLRRPAPGPVLKAEGRPLPRTVEGYVWGGLTSGGAAKAIWALLFPFSLANMASWMLPPVTDNRIGRTLAMCCRALLRVGALLLTVLLVGQLASVSMDVVAAQCLGPGSSCLGFLPGWVRTAPTLRTIIGLAPILIVVAILHGVSTVNWTVNAESTDDHKPRLMSRLPGAGLIADPDAPALRTLHLTAALATTVFLALGGPAGPISSVAAVFWSLALALIALTMIGVLAFGDPTGARPDRYGKGLRTALRAVPRRLTLALNLALIVAVVAIRPTLPTRLTDTDLTVQDIAIALGSVCVLLAVLLVPTALLARKQWAGQPKPLRPWAGGWMAAPVLAIAAALGGGFGAGIGLFVRTVLADHALVIPGGYAYITLLWGIAGLLGLIASVVAGIVLGTRRALAQRGGRGMPAEVPLLHADRPSDAMAAAKAWWLAGWARKSAPVILIGLGIVVGLGAFIAILLRNQQVLPSSISTSDAVGTAAAFLAGFGVVVLAALAGALLHEVYQAARNPNSARRLGGFSDLACFWPREAHPIVPPCYALKVVPELAARAAEYLAEPSTRVVLTGHSQGSVLVAVAASRLLATLPPHQTERLGIVVAGSPIQTAYVRAFPGVLGYAGLAELCTDLGGRWRSLCRGTDPIGGGVTTWDRQVFHGQLIGVGLVPDAPCGALPAATVSPTGALVLGGDHWLPDPARGPFPGRRWAPGVHRHSDYYSDPEWDRAVACAAGMESPSMTKSQPALFRLPGQRTAAG
ncbi:MAG TPA: hypothetical protein VGJ45_07515 [Pseudonocardiaceae bacterium]